MRLGFRYLSKLLLATALFSPLVNIGCAGHGYYRVYDPAYGDYHRWDNHETVYYNQWEVENHRQHTDFRKLNGDDQKNYFKWRHDHDHDNDKH